MVMKNIELKHAKRWTSYILTALIIGFGFSVTQVSAQNARVFQVEVPFDFIVMGRTYPAATYKIGRLSQADPDTLVLNSSAGKTLLIVRTQRLNSEAPSEFSQLTFSRYGETNYLEGIRASGDSYESRLPSVRSDRRLRRIAQAQLVSIRTK
jgi:hypothetical protein